VKNLPRLKQRYPQGICSVLCALEEDELMEQGDLDRLRDSLGPLPAPHSRDGSPGGARLLLQWTKVVTEVLGVPTPEEKEIFGKLHA